MTEREIAIGQQVRQACLAISGDLTNSADAKDAKKASDAAVEAGRLPVLLSVARLSIEQNWTEAEAMWGCQYAADQKGNDDRTAKTIATFCSEMKSVTSPKVRESVPDIVKACEDAWQAETDDIELDKDAPRPLREFAKRKYHLIITAIKEQRLGQIYITMPQDVVDWAEANDPAKNPDKVADKLANIASDLAGIFIYFNHADIQEAADALGRLDAKALRACRVHPDMTATLPKPPAKAAETTPQAPKPTPTLVAPLAPAPAPEPVAAPEAASEPHEGAAGLASFLNDPEDIEQEEPAELLAAD